MILVETPPPEPLVPEMSIEEKLEEKKKEAAAAAAAAAKGKKKGKTTETEAPPVVSFIENSIFDPFIVIYQ